MSISSGDGHFTAVQKQLQTVAEYIENQAAHHKVHNFREEYLDFLKIENIAFNSKYLFKNPK